MNVFAYSEEELRRFSEETCSRLASVTDGAEATALLADTLRKYTIFDLQTIGANIRFEVERLPEPYRARYRPYAQDLLDQYHGFVSHPPKNVEITDLQLWEEYWEKGTSVLFSEERAENDPRPALANPAGKLFYWLVYGYAMLIAGKTGHPVGMPFPGGWRIYEDHGKIYCPIREKEKNLPQALCNYCPAEQDPKYCILPHHYMDEREK